MEHAQMADILSAALNHYDVNEDGTVVLLTSLAEENAAFSEFDVQVDGEVFTIAVRKR